jgi:hypothetical protein
MGKPSVTGLQSLRVIDAVRSAPGRVSVISGPPAWAGYVALLALAGAISALLVFTDYWGTYFFWLPVLLMAAVAAVFLLSEEVTCSVNEPFLIRRVRVGGIPIHRAGLGDIRQGQFAVTTGVRDQESPRAGPDVTCLVFRRAGESNDEIVVAWGMNKRHQKLLVDLQDRLEAIAAASVEPAQVGTGTA